MGDGRYRYGRAGLAVMTFMGVLTLFASALQAQEAPTADISQAEQPSSARDWYSVHMQATYTTQGHDTFHSGIANGPQSMLNEEQMTETLDVTLYAGIRLGQLEVYYNPEMDQGYGPSSTYGVAAYTSGEAYKAGHYDPYYRTPRLFGRYVYDLSGEAIPIEEGINQLAGSHLSNNVTFTFGKFGIPDIFDTNTYAHDPKNDFLNWAIVESGAFDYGAELWGYTYGAAVEWNQDWWTLRGGFFDMSRMPNNGDLSVNFRNNQTILEAEERHDWFDQPGKIKLMGFLMDARMGAYADAVRWIEANQAFANTLTTPATQYVRKTRLRPGGGINLEQQIIPGLGAFLKASMNDGRYEEFDFTEINQSVTGGLSLKGDRWGRENDTIGLAGVISGISNQARSYFAAGGLGGLIGDGVLPSYNPESVIEAYYRVLFSPGLSMTLDYQHVTNPAYDGLRGPIEFGSVRFHLEY